MGRVKFMGTDIEIKPVKGCPYCKGTGSIEQRKVGGGIRKVACYCLTKQQHDALDYTRALEKQNRYLKR